MKLYQLISWPYLKKHVLRTVLTMTGVVLGVSVFVGMHAANQSVLLAFTQSIERIAGKTQLQVTAGEAGFGEEVLEKVQSAEHVTVAVPVIEAVVESTIAGRGDMLILGIDMTGDRSLREYDFEGGDDSIMEDPLIFLAQPDSLIVSKELADRNQLNTGSTLPLITSEGRRNFTVRGMMKAAGLATAFGGDIAVMDVYAAQKMFGRGRTFDRIDIALAEGTTTEQGASEISAIIGPGFDVQAPTQRGQQAESLLAGYNVMVNISSAFTLFIGMFIIYNSFAMAVAQRRSEIGILRALGTTQGQIKWLFLGESAILGLIGSAIGLGGGILLGRLIAASISALVGDLYGVAQRANDIAASPGLLMLALFVGITTSLIAAWFPAKQAAQIEPLQALRKGSYQIFSGRESSTRLGAAAVLAVLSAVSLSVSTLRPLFFLGYGLAIAAAVVAGPVLAVAIAYLIRPFLRMARPIEGALAADSLIQAPRRTSACVAALMLSLALVVAFSGMARGSYASIVDWMDTALNPDFFVMPSQRLDLRTTRFPAAMAKELASIRGVERVQMFRNTRVTFRDAQVMVVAIEMNSVIETNRSRPVAGNHDDMYRKAAAGEGVIVADNLAQLHRLRIGETVEVQAPYGVVSMPIVGIVTDFTDQQGTIFMDRSVFVRNWRDDSVNDFRIFLAGGAASTAVRDRIIARYSGKRQVFVLTNEQIRANVLEIANQWFSLMNLQIAVAVLVSMLGIVNMLTVSISDRRRELGVLRAVGALQEQVRRTIRLEAVSVAVIGLLLGYVLGALNLYYMLQIVERDIIGMRISYLYPVSTTVLLVPLIIMTALVAAIWPAKSAVRGSLVEALEYE